jgi:hypothetical protein
MFAFVDGVSQPDYNSAGTFPLMRFRVFALAQIRAGLPAQFGRPTRQAEFGGNATYEPTTMTTNTVILVV